MATIARLLPRFAARRWKHAAKYVFLVRAAPQAAWFKARRSQRFPLRVLPLLRLPALSLLPGHITAQEAKLLPWGNCSGLVPISATKLQAVVMRTPGIEVHNEMA